MKKLFTLLVLVLTALTTNARTIWTGTQELDWNAGKFLQLDATAMGTINAGDCLVFTYKVTVPDNSWPQFQVCNSSWNKLEGVGVKNGMTESKVYATPAMAQSLPSGMVVAGYGITLSKIELVEGDGGDYSHAVWIGECVIGNWSGYQTIDKNVFANAAAGQVLRIKFKDLGAGAYLSLRNPADGWPDLTDGAATYIAGAKQDYTITSGMLAELQANGLVVAGVNFTCTAVEIWNADDLRPLTLSVPVTDNWVFTDAAPSFTIKVTNPYSETITAKAVVSIATDKMVHVTSVTESKKIDGGASADIVIKLDDVTTPGIYHATATVNDDLARGFFFAVNPTEIVSEPDMQSDFNAYWTAAKEQLAAIPMNAQLTEITAKSTTNRKVYLVELQSVPDGLSGDPVTVRGYYCEPTDGKKHPVIMHYLGYDSGYRPGGTDVKPYCPSGDADPNYAEFYLSTRGQSINNRAANEREYDGKGDFTNTYGDWFAFNFGDKDSYYYRGAYMDLLRAIDFMASRETSDMNNLYAEGQSQGGAFTYAAAALSNYPFCAIAPGIPFLGDFPDYFEITSWPAYVAKENQGTMSDDEMYAFLSYYDTKNLATLISCPVISCIGLQDNVCPPHTNIAPYNNLQSTDKQVLFNPENGHQVAGNWYSTYMDFFKARQQATGIGATLNDHGEMINNHWYTLDGYKLDNKPTAKGIYIHRGKKIVI